MFKRKDNIQRRLLKIKEHESKSLQILDRQKQELEKAIEENDELIKTFLDTKSAEETSIVRELEDLCLRTNKLQAKLEQVKNNVICPSWKILS